MTLWRFENTGPSPGVFNMKKDEALAHALCKGKGYPTLRVYTWQPWALSVGWHQSLDDIDVEKVQRDGYDVVRRPTGGRAIFHAEELTYCVVFKTDNESIDKVYAHISQALLRSLALLGVRATFEKQQPHFPSLYRSATNVPCFSSAGRHEIMVNGKKLIGSAQRRYRAADGDQAVLQHGSILVGPAHRNLLHYLRVSPQTREQIQLAFDTKTTELSTVLQQTVRLSDIVEALRCGFEEVWRIRFVTTTECVST